MAGGKTLPDLRTKDRVKEIQIRIPLLTLAVEEGRLPIIACILISWARDQRSASDVTEFANLTIALRGLRFRTSTRFASDFSMARKAV